MKLSVIIPCLKRDEWVERAIRSVGSCDGVEVEFIVVEGVSPVGKARNIGLERATGDYVVWLDGDDEVSQDFLKEIVAVLRECPSCDVIVHGISFCEGNDRRDCCWPQRQGRVPLAVLLTDVYHHLEQLSNLVLYVSRRELWAGLRFDESLLIGEDDVMVPQMLLKAKSCWHLNKSLYHYQVHSNSLSTDWDDKKASDLIRIKEIRLRNAPAKYRRAAVWGAAVGHYWSADLAALRGMETKNAAFGRKWIRHHFHTLVAEALFGHGMSLRIRLGWVIRFACAAMNFWLLHRLRDRHWAEGRSAQ